MKEKFGLDEENSMLGDGPSKAIKGMAHNRKLQIKQL